MFRDRQGSRRPIARIGGTRGPLLRRLLEDGRRDRRRRPAPLVRGRLQPARPRRPPAQALGPEDRRDRPGRRQGLGEVRHPARPGDGTGRRSARSSPASSTSSWATSTRSTSKGRSKLLKESLKALGSDAVVEIVPGKDHMNLLDRRPRRAARPRDEGGGRGRSLSPRGLSHLAFRAVDSLCVNSFGSAWSSVPEVVRGQFQAQDLVGAGLLAGTRAEPVAVPVQPLQVEHRLRHPPCDATAASAARCSCTPPRCWPGTCPTAPPTPGRTTPAPARSTRARDPPHRTSLISGSPARRPAVRQPPPPGHRLTPLRIAARPTPVAGASGPGSSGREGP